MKELILIADDNITMLNVAQFAFEKEYDVLVAVSPEEALDLYYLFPGIKFIISDIYFGSDKMGGHELAVILREVGYRGCIILITGYVYRLEKKYLDCIDLLKKKPFSVEELLDWMREYGRLMNIEKLAARMEPGSIAGTGDER